MPCVLWGISQAAEQCPHTLCFFQSLIHWNMKQGLFWLALLHSTILTNSLCYEKNHINEMNIGICKYAFSRYCQGGGLCSVFKVAMQSNVVVGIYSPVAFAQDTLVKIWALSVWTQNRFKKITVKPVKPLKMIHVGLVSLQTMTLQCKQFSNTELLLSFKTSWKCQKCSMENPSASCHCACGSSLHLITVESWVVVALVPYEVMYA